MKIFLRLALIWIFIYTALPAHCASIIAMCRNTNRSVRRCAPKNIFFPTYSTSNNIMKYRIDRGAIGEISQADAKNFAEEVLGLWETQSGIDFQASGDGYLPVDVTRNNYRTYLNNRKALGYSPVIWDQSGSLIDELFGGGAKLNILGFAGVNIYKKNKNGFALGITESQSVFNGFLFDGANTGEDTTTVVNNFKTTILHEFGHMFGLDHTQGGDMEGYLNYDPQQDSLSALENIPVMFPISANPLVELQQDDIAAVRLAYPKGDEASLYGSISGTLKQIGAGIKGANVIAYPIDDPEPRKRAVACPSDVDGRGMGKFLLANLVPGKYIIKAEPLNENFIGGSAVGIHYPIDPSNLIESFYMGDGVAALRSSDLNTGIAQAYQITVSAGSMANINFDLDLATFKFKSNRLRDPIRLNDRSKRVIRLTLQNLYPGQTRNLELTTSYPGLIEFLPTQINFSKKYFTIKIRLASYASFLAQLPEIENSGVKIPIQIDDLNTGYTLDTEEFWLF
jgi:hypothetical protein